jgi:hypothetical protein
MLNFSALEKRTVEAETREKGTAQEFRVSFVQVLREVVEDLRISAPAFRLYVMLLGISRWFPSCWPGQKALAAKLGGK